MDRLNDRDGGVRWSAVELLAGVGGAGDASPVVALLCDPDSRIVRSAAKTLAAIGGPNELAALNTWLAVRKFEFVAKNNPELKNEVTQCRDELKAKVDPVRPGAVLDLADPDKDKRLTAIKVLEQAGRERDAPALLALLADAELPVGVAAAKAVAAIGGPRELKALNTWLGVTTTDQYTIEWRGKYQVLKRSVIDARTEMKTRLDKAAKK